MSKPRHPALPPIHPNREQRNKQKRERQAAHNQSELAQWDRERKEKQAEQARKDQAVAAVTSTRRGRDEEIDSLRISGHEQAGVQMHRRNLIGEDGKPALTGEFVAYLQRHDSLKEYEPSVLRQAMERLARELPRHYRAVVARYEHNESYRDVGALLGCSHTWAKQLERSGRDWLRAYCIDLSRPQELKDLGVVGG